MRDWFIFEEIPRAQYHLFESVFRYWGKGMKKDAGNAVDILAVFREGDMFFCFTRKGYQKAGKRVLEKALKNPEWLLERSNLTITLSNRLIKESKKLQKKDFSKLSDKELEKTFSSHMNLHLRCHEAGMLSLVLEFEHEMLSDYLKKRIQEKNPDLKVGETFSLLTIPRHETFQAKQEREIVGLAQKILKIPSARKLFRKKTVSQVIEALPSVNPKLNKEIEKHFLRYRWLPYMYVGPAWDKDYFIEQLKGLVKDEKEVPGILKKMRSRIPGAKENQRKLLKLLKPDKKRRLLLRAAQRIVYEKAIRKDAMYCSFFSYEPLLREIGKRLGLSLNQLRFMWPGEFKKAILKHDFDSNELNERFKFSVYLSVNGKEQTLTGKKARQINEKEAPKPKEYRITELEGSTAVPGLVKGIAKLINLPEEMNKMKLGNVMVSHATNPNIVPAMKKAAAIVTDLGGITCHAAIVSRELNIPCVVGTKFATKVFKDGDLIHVNANHGIIKKLKE